MAERIVIVGSCRTPMGKVGGQLAKCTALELLITCFRETIKRMGSVYHHVFVNFFDQVIVGQVAQSSDAPNIARLGSRLAGLVNETPTFTVQHNCGSGLQALVSACQMIKAGEAKAVLVGGTESMSNIPFVSRDLRFGKRYFDSKLIDAMMEGLTDPLLKALMGELAERLATEYKISREDQDAFAVRSHQNAHQANVAGKFAGQIVPVFPTDSKQGVYKDESINPALNMQMLANTPEKYFFQKGGTVHFGNSCPTSDGAASFAVMTLEWAQFYRLQPEVEVLGYAFRGCEPEFFGLGPVSAIPRALANARVSRQDVDLFEINEAFAVQALACQRNLEIPLDKVNVWGGAIAMGHPVGATGAILTTKIIAMLNDLQKDIGVVSMCIGGGEGGAAVLRRWKD